MPNPSMCDNSLLFQEIGGREFLDWFLFFSLVFFFLRQERQHSELVMYGYVTPTELLRPKLFFYPFLPFIYLIPKTKKYTTLLFKSQVHDYHRPKISLFKKQFNFDIFKEENESNRYPIAEDNDRFMVSEMLRLRDYFVNFSHHFLALPHLNVEFYTRNFFHIFSEASRTLHDRYNYDSSLLPFQYEIYPERFSSFLEVFTNKNLDFIFDELNEQKILPLFEYEIIIEEDDFSEEDSTSRYASDPLLLLLTFLLLLFSPNYISLYLLSFLPMLLSLYFSFDKEISFRNSSISGDYSTVMVDEQTDEDLVSYFSLNYFSMDETVDLPSEEIEYSLPDLLEGEEEDLCEYSEDEEELDESDLYDLEDPMIEADFPFEADFDREGWMDEILYIYSWSIQETWLRKTVFQAMDRDSSTAYDYWERMALYVERGYDFLEHQYLM